MVHLPQLIVDLGLIMTAAAIVTFIFKKLRQPTVLGYILAGLLVGPHFSLFPSVAEHENIEVWAEIGVIFLLFSLGLEFSFKKLMKVGGSSSITALVEVAVMLLLGYVSGTIMGWTMMDSIFLGGVLSISSTTIIIRAFDELGLKGKRFVSLVFGILVVEDLVAIVLLVLLSTLAVSRQFNGMEMAFSVIKLGFFLVLWFVSGIFFLPTLLRKAKGLMNDEMLLISSLALCMLMVILATNVGFSPALGAFIMGSILSETTLGGKIEHLTKSVKDVFGAVFFVSVGMLIDPAVLAEYAVPILVIVLITICGKMLSTTIGALISGQPLKTSVQAGMSLAQIGEFSFIIATLGLTLNVTSAFLYPITVAVSAVTTFSTPYMIKYSAGLYGWLNLHLPGKMVSAIERYSSATQTIKQDSDWKKLLLSTLKQTVIYTVIIFAIVFLVSSYLEGDGNRARDSLADILITVVVLAGISPFLWALAIRKIQPEATSNLWKDSRYKGPVLMLHIFRWLLAILLIMYFINTFLSFFYALAALGGIILLVLFNYRRLQSIYEKIERRFLANYLDKEEEEKRYNRADLAPWDAHITTLVISADYKGIGKSLAELQFREKMGVNIVMIKRGHSIIRVPDRDEHLYPFDTVHVIGTDDQIDMLRKELETDINQHTDMETIEPDISLHHVLLRTDLEFTGKTIKESGIRERTNGVVVGVERNGKRILNPESSMLLEANDMLWIVGSRKRIKSLFREHDKNVS